MKVLMLSAPLKLTMILLREVEQPVKPRTPLVRFRNTLGNAILYQEHSLQFQACTLTADSQAMADMQAISRAMAGEYAAWTEESRQRRPSRTVEMGFILLIKYLIICCQIKREEAPCCMAALKYNQFVKESCLIDMSSPLNYNNPAALLGRQQSAVFWKRMRRPQRQHFDPKNAQQNPIYKFMRKRRELSPVYGRIGYKPEPVRPFQRAFTSNTSHADHQGELIPIKKFNKSQSTQQIETFKEKALRIVAGTKQFTAELKGSKRKVQILDKFSRKVEKYCSYLAESPEEETNESQHANDQLIELCRHRFFPTQDLHKRAHSLLNYQEPRISTNKLQSMKDRSKVSSLGKTQDSSKKRMVTLNV